MKHWQIFSYKYQKLPRDLPDLNNWSLRFFFSVVLWNYGQFSWYPSTFVLASHLKQLSLKRAKNVYNSLYTCTCVYIVIDKYRPKKCLFITNKMVTNILEMLCDWNFHSYSRLWKISFYWIFQIFIHARFIWIWNDTCDLMAWI